MMDVDIHVSLLVRVWAFIKTHARNKVGTEKALAAIVLGSLIFLMHWLLGRISRIEGLGGGISTPSFSSSWVVWLSCIALLAVVGGLSYYLWRKKPKVEKEEKPTAEKVVVETKKKEEEKRGVLRMDNVVVVLFSFLGACWTVWWVYSSFTFQSKDILAIILGVIFLSEAWNIFANTKDSLRFYQWIIRLWVLVVGVGVVAYFGFTHLTLGFHL